MAKDVINTGDANELRGATFGTVVFDEIAALNVGKAKRFYEDRDLVFNAAAFIQTNTHVAGGMMPDPAVAVTAAIALWNVFDELSFKYGEGLEEGE